MKASFCRLTILLLFGAAPFIVETGNPAPPVESSAPARPLVLVKAESIKVESFVVEKVDADECIAYLRRKSVENDPEKPGGLNFESWLGPSTPLVTLSLKNASVLEICREISKATGLVMSISNFKIVFHPRGRRPAPRQDEVYFDPPQKSAVQLKAESIRFDRMRFDGADINECVHFLRVQSTRSDKEKDPNGAKITRMLKICDSVFGEGWSS